MEDPQGALAVLNRLRALGCDGAQGYYISRPLAAERLAQWVAANGGEFSPQLEDAGTEADA